MSSQSPKSTTTSLTELPPSPKSSHKKHSHRKHRGHNKKHLRHKKRRKHPKHSDERKDSDDFSHAEELSQSVKWFSSRCFCVKSMEDFFLWKVELVWRKPPKCFMCFGLSTECNMCIVQLRMAHWVRVLLLKVVSMFISCICYQIVHMKESWFVFSKWQLNLGLGCIKSFTSLVRLWMLF